MAANPVQKLDKKFYGRIFKAKDSMEVPKDQYVVFLAKDDAFAAMLPKYLEECRRLDCDAEHIKMVEELISNVQVWRAAHPELCKRPDAKGERTVDFTMGGDPGPGDLEGR